MSTGYFYNGFGQYEKKGTTAGITLRYGGVDFWFPFKKVTPVPDFHFREVDHAATAEAWEDGNDDALIYTVHRIPGNRIVEELTETQDPIKNREKGMLALNVTKDRLSDKYIKVPAGWDENGKPQSEEVRIVTATPEEMERAETLSLEYKKTEIERYFQSKRERMAGHQGYLTPPGLIKTYMAELGVKDIDQVTIQNQTPATGLSPEAAQDFLALLSQALMKGINGDQALALAQKAVGKIATSKEEKEKISEAALT